MDKRFANQFLTAAEVAQMLHISKSHAYKIVHRLNQELKAQGVLTIAGRINRVWLMERITGNHTERRSNQMAVYKDTATNTWRVIYRYRDWTGEQKQTSKRGFTTKREAQVWEREQMKA